MDAVTQWQVVGCVGRISEQHLLPVLQAIFLHQFPYLLPNHYHRMLDPATSRLEPRGRQDGPYHITHRAVTGGEASFRAAVIAGAESSV